MSRSFRVVLLIALSLQLSSWVSAAPTSDEVRQLLKQFDINGDGKLDDIEIKIALIIKNKLAPIDLEGIKQKYKRLHRPITEEDLNLTSAESLQAVILFKDFQTKYSDRAKAANRYEPALIEAVDLGVQAPPLKVRLNENYVVGGPKIKIRRTDDQLKFADLADAQSALFSFARNFDTSGNTFTAQGAIGIDVPITESPAEVLQPDKTTVQDLSVEHPFELRSFDLLLSSTFNRIGGDVPASKKVDSLIGRLGTQTVLANHNALGQFLDGEILVTNFTFTTDFEGKQQVVGGEFNFTPVRFDMGLGSFRGFGPAVTSDGNPLIKVLFNLVLHLEGGSVLDPGGNPALLGRSNYVRVGPLIGAKIVPVKLPELALSVQYNFYKEVDDPMNLDNELFSAAAEWNIGGNDHYNLKLEYQHGRTPIVNQSVNSMTAGFGVKY